jgi:DNA-binding PadR family transcriptional regulator
VAELLKPQWFHILLSVADQRRHGYAIQRDVLEQTNGAIMLWPAMLYRSLSALVELGLIAPVDPPAEESPDERRQYYRITPVGRRRLVAEAEQMSEWAISARQKVSTSRPERA